MRTVLAVFTILASVMGVSSLGYADGNMLRVRIGSDVGVLDPARIFGIENQTVAGHIYNGLVKYDQATNNIIPDLATEWSCLLYTSPSPRDGLLSRMPSSA